MADWKTNFPRNFGANRYLNEDAASLTAFITNIVTTILATAVPGIFDPANPVFHGTNTGTPWTGVFGNGGLNTTTVGPDAKTTTTPASAFGWKSIASAVGAVAMGVGNTTSAVTASGVRSVAIGTAGNFGSPAPIAAGPDNVVVGSGCGANGGGAFNMVFGSVCGVLGALSTGNGYFGFAGSITGNNTWIFGQSIIVGNDTIVMGNITGGTGNNNVYLGASLAPSATYSGSGQTHVGSAQAGSTADGTTALGINTTANATAATALGPGAAATAVNALAVGPNAQATALGAVGAGFGSTASGIGATALGPVSVASGQASIAAGPQSLASGAKALSLGDTSTASAAGALAIGPTSNATAAGAVALGDRAASVATNGLALGILSAAGAANANAFGAGIANSVANSTIIGSNAVPAFRIPDPDVATIITQRLPQSLAGAAPAPTVAQIATGLLELSNPVAVTYDQTNITGANLDAFAAFAPVKTFMSFEVMLVPTGGAVLTIGAAGAGVTAQFGVLVGAAGATKRIIYSRTGLNTWNSYVL